MVVLLMRSIITYYAIPTTYFLNKREIPHGNATRYLMPLTILASKVL
jgi:hypothetical protein